MLSLRITSFTYACRVDQIVKRVGPGSYGLLQVLHESFEKSAWIDGMQLRQTLQSRLPDWPHELVCRRIGKLLAEGYLEMPQSSSEAAHLL